MATKIYVVDEKEGGETAVLYSFGNDLIKIHHDFKIDEFDKFLTSLKLVVISIEEFGRDFVTNII